MTKYNVSPLVAREIEFSTGTIFGGSWCRYFISITLHQCYIEATWKTRPKNDLDGHKEIFNSLQEYLDWFANLKKTYGRRISRKQMVYHIQLSGNYPEESEAWDKFLEENQWKIYPLLANIMQVFLPTGNYQLFYTQYPQGFISIIAKPHDK